MNKVELTGRIAQDLELRKTKQNKSVLSFAIATDKGKDQNGNRMADFINVQCWEQRADFLNQYAFKGVMIGIVGRIENSNYTNQQGQKIQRTYVVAEQVEILSKPQERKQQAPQPAPNPVNTSYTTDFEDDDLPFM